MWDVVGLVATIGAVVMSLYNTYRASQFMRNIEHLIEEMVHDGDTMHASIFAVEMLQVYVKNNGIARRAKITDAIVKMIATIYIEIDWDKHPLDNVKFYRQVEALFDAAPELYGTLGKTLSNDDLGISYDSGLGAYEKGILAVTKMANGGLQNRMHKV